MVSSLCIERSQNKNITPVILHEALTAGGEGKTKTTRAEGISAVRVEANEAHSKKNRLIAALAGACLLIAGGVVAWNAVSNGQKIPVGAESSAPVDPSENNENSPLIEGDNLTETLEDLSQMSAEQITALATISVESVSVDGVIDWELYAQKLFNIIELNINSGTSDADMEVYDKDGKPGADYTSKYDNSFEAGFTVQGVNLGGVHDMHLNQFTIAYASWLLDKDTVRTNFDLKDVEVIRSDENGATLSLTNHVTDNYFSSGVLNADSSRDVATAGRSADADLSMTQNYHIENVDGDLKLVLVD